MRIFCFIFSIMALTACASTNSTNRQVASSDITGELQIKNQTVKYTIVDRGWRTSTGSAEVSLNNQDAVVVGPFPTIEAVKSYLIIHQANSAQSYNQVKVESALKASEQCQTFGANERANVKNQVDGYTTTVTAKIVNNLEMPADFTSRFVCLVSVLAARK